MLERNAQVLIVGGGSYERGTPVNARTQRAGSDRRDARRGRPLLALPLALPLWVQEGSEILIPEPRNLNP